MPKTLKQTKHAALPRLIKCPTGIKGFDQITEGGLPKNRTTLVSGSAGSGKTLLGLDFLINGAVNYKERGVFMSFEETEEELYKDVASLNLDLRGLVSQKKREGVAVRCVSMPSWDRFDALPKADRDAVLPPSVRTRLAVEAGATQGWHRYVGDSADVIGVDQFGASAPGETVLREYGFTIDSVDARAKALL
jgi:KaiC/GvpD/RAD55 family RecA-like ATPase